MISTIQERNETRAKFYDAARKMYPKVGEPGTVWVLTQVLGWSWDRIEATSVEGFSRKGYRVFMIDTDEYGKKYKRRDLSTPDHDPVIVSREWTNKEKSKLKDWWWLLGF